MDGVVSVDSRLTSAFIQYLKLRRRTVNLSLMEAKQTINVRIAPGIEYYNATKPEKLLLRMTFPHEIVSAKQQLEHILSQFLDLVDEENNGKSYTILDSGGKLSSIPSDT
jgi:hypothetical protein